jgi:hypothetical protein
MLPPPNPASVREALGQFDREKRGDPEYIGWEAKASQRFALNVDGKLYPPKAIVSLATGVPVGQFSGGREANSWLASAGFQVELIRFPPKSEIRIALHELLLERAPEGVETEQAYQLLAERLSIPEALQKKLMDGPNPELHWNNRVRYARLELVEQKRLDGSERGVWKIARRDEKKIWIEKTNAANRLDRTEGNFAVGRALWSPKRMRDDSDGYWAMRDVQPGDLVLHLVDNESFTGVSIVDSWADPNFVGIAGTDWAGLPCYLVKLRDFTPCVPPLRRELVLESPAFRETLLRIRATGKNLFYDKNLDLNQGHYFTEAVPELALLLDRAYGGAAGTGLPHFSDELREALSKGVAAIVPSPVDVPPEQPADLEVHSLLSQLSPDNNIWLYAPGENARMWDEIRREGLVTIGWDNLGDLRQYADKNAIAAALNARSGGEGYPMHAVQACYEFVHEMKPGDLLIAKSGQTRLLGVGMVTGEYEHRADRIEHKNVRTADWKLVGDWPSPELLVTKTLTYKRPSEAERLLRTIFAASDGETVDLRSESKSPAVPATLPTQPTYSLPELCDDLAVDSEIAETWIARLRRKKQLIFQGPPGTGKTYIAQSIARHLVSETTGQWDLIQFHPSYGYEDFVYGIQPEISSGRLSFDRVPGRFVQFCELARKTKAPHVFIIDEFNRANVSRVLGEIMFLLEYREQHATLAGGKRFTIPENLYVIGTMNTADRSIALVDHALRRRFTFIHLGPDYQALERHLSKFGLPAQSLVAVLKRLNAAIGDRNYEIGISFFLKDEQELRNTLGAIWEGEIEPYLEEYFYADPGRIEPFRWPSLVTGPLVEWQPIT